MALQHFLDIDEDELVHEEEIMKMIKKAYINGKKKIVLPYKDKDGNPIVIRIRGVSEEGITWHRDTEEDEEES